MLVRRSVVHLTVFLTIAGILAVLVVLSPYLPGRGFKYVPGKGYVRRTLQENLSELKAGYIAFFRVAPKTDLIYPPVARRRIYDKLQETRKSRKGAPPSHFKKRLAEKIKRDMEQKIKSFQVQRTGEAPAVLKRY